MEKEICVRGALGQVRRVEDVMCSEQVQQGGVGGDIAQGWMCRVPHCGQIE